MYYMRFYFILFSVLCCLSAVAADTTRAGKFRRNFGAFGGLGFGYTKMDTETISLNLQGGLIYRHWLSTGVFAMAFFTASPLSDSITGDDAYLTGGYGGLFIAPVICSSKLIHAAIPVSAGAGYGYVGYTLYDDTEIGHTEGSSRFWILEPGLEVEVNLLRFVRMAIGGYYRYCGNVHLNYEDSNELIVPEGMLNHFSVGVKFRFGRF